MRRFGDFFLSFLAKNVAFKCWTQKKATREYESLEFKGIMAIQISNTLFKKGQWSNYKSEYEITNPHHLN